MTITEPTLQRLSSAEDSLLSSTEITPEIIELVTRRIVDAIRPQKIVLFGSQATGDAESESDLDLLVVHDSKRSDREARLFLDRLFLQRRFGLDLLVRTPEEVSRNLADVNPFYTDHIFGRGIVLYERSQQETS
ncbi:MAG: nucleotidyltransferase domain-containing protein [Caldilineales bacterium]|nr:nucleotidyltransferase domain-containing protein [Caldilineales bacterium]MCW5858563.1 nucleotidyltransferase domain-containing protein [Caldilineales bacterium]